MTKSVRERKAGIEVLREREDEASGVSRGEKERRGRVGAAHLNEIARTIHKSRG